MSAAAIVPRWSRRSASSSPVLRRARRSASGPKSRCSSGELRSTSDTPRQSKPPVRDATRWRPPAILFVRPPARHAPRPSRALLAASSEHLGGRRAAEKNGGVISSIEADARPASSIPDIVQRAGLALYPTRAAPSPARGVSTATACLRSADVPTRRTRPDDCGPFSSGTVPDRVKATQPASRDPGKLRVPLVRPGTEPRSIVWRTRRLREGSNPPQPDRLRASRFTVEWVPVEGGLPALERVPRPRGGPRAATFAVELPNGPRLRRARPRPRGSPTRCSLTGSARRAADPAGGDLLADPRITSSRSSRATSSPVGAEHRLRDVRRASGRRARRGSDRCGRASRVGCASRLLRELEHRRRAGGERLKSSFVASGCSIAETIPRARSAP